MRKDNSAVYECPKGRSTLHTWKRAQDGTAVCVECKLVLTKADADEVFEESPRRPRVRPTQGICIDPQCECMQDFGHCIVTGRLPI